MELVTGFAGQAHVDPIDMAHLNAVAFGHDAYLLDTQNKLEPTLETANKLVVDTGDLMIQGHHFTVVQSEEIALQSGVSGQKRNALVCARYDKAEGTGVESASWIVKYGTATTGTPADPSVTTGNILDGVDSVHEEPIFRIEYDGITPGDPILLVPEFQSAADFRTSIGQVLWEGELGVNQTISVPGISQCKTIGITVEGYCEQQIEVNLDSGTYINNSWVSENGTFNLATVFFVVYSNDTVKVSSSVEKGYSVDSSNWVKMYSSKTLKVKRIRKLA